MLLGFGFKLWELPHYNFLVAELAQPVLGLLQEVSDLGSFVPLLDGFVEVFDEVLEGLKLFTLAYVSEAHEDHLLVESALFEVLSVFEHLVDGGVDHFFG